MQIDCLSHSGGQPGGIARRFALPHKQLLCSCECQHLHSLTFNAASVRGVDRQSA